MPSWHPLGVSANVLPDLSFLAEMLLEGGPSHTHGHLTCKHAVTASQEVCEESQPQTHQHTEHILATKPCAPCCSLISNRCCLTLWGFANPCGCLDGACRATVIFTKPCCPGSASRHRPCGFTVRLHWRGRQSAGRPLQMGLTGYLAASAAAV